MCVDVLLEVLCTRCSKAASWAVDSWTQLESGARTDRVNIRADSRCRQIVIITHPNLEWQIVDLALHAYKKVGVSLYDTLGKDSVGKCGSRFSSHCLLI